MATTWSTSRVPNTTPDDYQRRKVAKIAIIAPAAADIGPSLANQGVASWPDYRTRRLAPLLAAGGRLVWQFGENEELVRIYLDDSLERGGEPCGLGRDDQHIDRLFQAGHNKRCRAQGRERRHCRNPRYRPE